MQRDVPTLDHIYNYNLDRPTSEEYGPLNAIDVTSDDSCSSEYQFLSPLLKSCYTSTPVHGSSVAATGSQDAFWRVHPGELISQGRIVVFSDGSRTGLSTERDMWRAAAAGWWGDEHPFNFNIPLADLLKQTKEESFTPSSRFYDANGARLRSDRTPCGC